MSETKQLARTDRHYNPTAFTTEIAEQAGLRLNRDYSQGDPFKSGGKTYYTARLIGDPLSITVRVINKLTFYTATGKPRWSYIAIPPEVWQTLGIQQRKLVMKFMYAREGGVALAHLFEDV